MVNGGREAVTRLVILALAVGLGVGLLLTAVAATNAAIAWNNRHAWFWTGTSSAPAGPAARNRATVVASGRRRLRRPADRTLRRGRHRRLVPGTTGPSRDPAPGQYYASPALVALMRSTPANQLADRYPGHLAGTIGDAALPSPDSLAIVIGRTPAQLAQTPTGSR